MPFPFAVGEILTATNLNAALGGTATVFTPSFTNLTIGDGTLSGRRVQIGAYMHIETTISFGSTTSITGNLTFNLPVNAITHSLGVATYLDSGTRHFVGAVQFSSTSACLFAHSEAGNAGIVDATNPFTWTTGDLLAATLAYLVL